MRRFLAAVLLAWVLCFSFAGAQPPPAPAPAPAKPPPVLPPGTPPALTERGSPVFQYFVIFLATGLLLMIICSPSRKG
jgi:hypothetical protein